MMRRLSVYTICLICGLSVLVIINIMSQYADKTYYVKEDENGLTDVDKIPVTMNENHVYDQPHTKDIHRNVLNEISISADIYKILEKARKNIKNELSNYNYSYSDANRLEDLVMEYGGQPLRSLVISQWRSGSTFLGNLLNAVPSTYYHYEPLLMFGTKQIRVPGKAIEALRMVKQMFKCNFSSLEDYFGFESKIFNRFSHNTKLFDYCKGEFENELCFNAGFSTRLCKLFPFQTMKLTRLRLRVVEDILNDKELNVKVILLVRDPRGMLQSRQHANFCKLSPDCWEPQLVCADLVSDYVIASQILQKYPDRLMVIRFEDLALKSNITADRIIKFLKLDGRKVFHEFLQSHTTVEMAGFHSTFKVSRNIPFKWKTSLAYSYVNDLQMACKEAMYLWGYRMAHNATHMTSKDFNPIGEYSI